MKWLRLYSEFATDPKVQIMDEALQRRLIMLFCLHVENVLATLHATEIAFALRISEQELEETKAIFMQKGFINETWNLINWAKRQYVSDSSTERSRKHREKIKKEVQRECNVAATAPDTEQIQNREGVKEETNVSSKKNSRRSFSYSPELEEFWREYPRNAASKQEVAKLFLKAIKEGTSHEAIISATKKYRKYLERTGITVAHATTWLNQQRWTVDYDSLTVEPGYQRQPSVGTNKPSRLDIMRDAVRQTTNGGKSDFRTG